MRTQLRIFVATLLALAAIVAAYLLLSNAPTTPGPNDGSAPSPTSSVSPAPSPTSSVSRAPTPVPAPSDPLALPVAETIGFSGSGDISDDSAIWVDPANAANSVVVADNKAASGGGID